MLTKQLPQLFAIVAITVLAGIALGQGQDGAIFAASLATLAGLGGYNIRQSTNKPLFSLTAFGQVTRNLIVRRRGSAAVLEQKPYPKDARSSGQLAWRTLYQLAVSLWHTLPAAEKKAWESVATPHHMTGYAYFLSQALRPNPGIYLPLAGGTMTGNVAANPGVTFDGVDLSEIPLGSYLPLAGGTMAGPIDMDGNDIINWPHHAEHEPGGADPMATDAPVATPSLRSLGSGALQASPGNHTHTLLEDVKGVGTSVGVSASAGTYLRSSLSIAAGADSPLESKTQTYAPTSRAVGFAYCLGLASAANSLKLRLHMGGVQVAESGFISNIGVTVYNIIATTPLSGSQTVSAALHNYAAVPVTWYSFGSGLGICRGYSVAAGSIKV
jgi:hypothetical protein